MKLYKELSHGSGRPSAGRDAAPFDALLGVLGRRSQCLTYRAAFMADGAFAASQGLCNGTQVLPFGFDATACLKHCKKSVAI